MLILSRQKGQSIRINDDIEVIVVGINGNQVRIGITAPAHVKVDRQEIFERKALGLPKEVANADA
jgi:carbon storage regulator